MHINSYDIENNLKRSLTMEDINSVQSHIEDAIVDLNRIKGLIPAKVDYVKTVTNRYRVVVFHHSSKGCSFEYHDTDENWNTMPRRTGSHYSVTVTTHTIHDNHIIKSEHHDCQYSRAFSWKKKELMQKYVAHLEEKLGVTVEPASEDPEIVNDNCILASARVILPLKNSYWQMVS